MIKNMTYILCAVMVVFCSSAHAKRWFDNALLLSPNMSKKEVLDTMGREPTAAEFVGELEEWHFCKKNSGGSKDFISVFFVSGKVIAMKMYGVGENSRGTCKSQIKSGSYREPDVVREYRLKVR